MTMKLTNNTVFITGGTSGIGRAMAEKFHQLGNQVIISGRREALLKEVTAASPGMDYVVLDVTSADSIKAAAQSVLARYPALNVVIKRLLTPASCLSTTRLASWTMRRRSPCWTPIFLGRCASVPPLSNT